MLEKKIENLTNAITQLANAIIEREAPQTVEREAPQTVDLSTAPVAAPVPGINGAEVLPKPPVGINKAELWELLQQTYTTLQSYNRGSEVGVALQEFNAMHLDEVAPEHYPALKIKLTELKGSV